MVITHSQMNLPISKAKYSWLPKHQKVEPTTLLKISSWHSEKLQNKISKKNYFDMKLTYIVLITIQQTDSIIDYTHTHSFHNLFHYGLS